MKFKQKVNLLIAFYFFSILLGQSNPIGKNPQIMEKNARINRENIKPDWVELTEINGKMYKKIYMRAGKLARKFGSSMDMDRYKGYYLHEVLPDIYDLVNSIAYDPIVDSVQVIDSLTALIYITKSNYILKYGVGKLDPMDGEYPGYYIYQLAVPAPYLPIYPNYPEDKPEVIEKRTPYSRAFQNDDGSYTTILTIKPTSYPVGEGNTINWIDIPPDEPISESILQRINQRDNVVLNGTYYGFVKEINDGLPPYNYVYNNSNYGCVIGSGENCDLWADGYYRVFSQFNTSSLDAGLDITDVQYESYITDNDPADYDASNCSFDDPEIYPLINDMDNLPSDEYQGEGGIDSNNDILYNDCWDGTNYYNGGGYIWDVGDGDISADFNNSGVSNFQSNYSSGSYAIGVVDYAENNEDPDYFEGIVVTPYYDELSVTYVPPPALTVTPSNRDVSYGSGSTTFSVSSNINWSTSANVTWLSVSPTSGSDNGTIMASYQANSSTSSRTATITVTGSGITRTVTITQAGTPDHLTVTPSNRDVSYGSGSTTFIVSSNISWSTSANVTWLSVTPTNDSGDDQITASYQANSSTSSRTATITVTGSGITRTVTVTQEGEPYLTVTPSNRDVSYGSGSTTFSVSSNISWSTSANVTWLSVSPTNDSGNDQITASYQANSSTSSRTATITVTGNGITRTVTVTQAGAPPPPGTISGNISTNSSNFVEGVQVCTSPGNYCNNTNSDGNYTITGIEYGTSTTYTVTPSLSGHSFSPPSRERTLSTSYYNDNNVDFTDNSVFTVSGDIKYQNTNCPVAEVHILVNGSDTNPPTIIGDNGLFSVDVEYGTHTITPSLDGHTFEPAYWQGLIEESTTIPTFWDQLTYTISGKVVGGCDISIGAAEITIISTDGCYTHDPISADPVNGTYNVDLPPLVYYVDASIPSDPLIQFETQTIDLTQGEQTAVDFIHHNPIEIELSGFPEIVGSCDISVLQQGESYEIEISVFERYGDDICPLVSGELEIYNDIGTEEDQTVVQVVDGIANYTLVAGEPNILDAANHAYQKQLEVFITTNAETISQDQWVIVEGHRPREETFTTVSPELPLVILRDPPGDESYSFLSTETELCYTSSIGFELSAGVELFATAKIGAQFPGVGGISGNVSSSLEVGGGAIGREDVEICVSTETIFQTSDNEELTGPEGDVFGGAAINLIYAITDVLEVDENCNVIISQNIAWEGNGFDTHYLYTQSHIQNVLIPQLEETGEIEAAELWQSILELNDNLKIEADFILNRSFSAGATTDYSESVSITETKFVEYYMYIDAEVAAEAGVEVLGSGGTAGVKVKARLNMGASQEVSFSHTNTVGYSLRDNDTGDFFSLDIKGDPVYGTHIFDLLSGASSCPWEHPTQPREGVNLTIDPSEQNDVPPDDSAVFTLSLGNTSQTNEDREYYLSVVTESNSEGAIISVAGVTIENYLSFTIPAGEQIQAAMTVMHGSNAYDYENLQVELYSPCDHEQISDTVTFSVQFIPPCSDVTIGSPGDNWIINQSSNDTLQMILTGYDIIYANLFRLKIQYKPSDQWIDGPVIEIADLPQGSVVIDWDVSFINDGEYDLRAVAVCVAGENPSDVLSGTIDRISPAPFGDPDPADGILSAGDEISIMFSELIDCNSASSECVSLVFEDNSTPINIQMICNNDEIIITPDVANYYIENQTLTATIDTCVTDLFGNELAQPISWSFYIDQNIVRWNPVNIIQTIVEGESLILSSTLENEGGQNESFSIIDFAEWITPESLSGVIPPSGSFPIDFNINNILTAGTYTDTVIAQTAGGDEPLYVTVNVMCPSPPWQINESDYEFNMSLTGVILFEDVESTDENDLIGAFVGDECRGVSQPSEFPPTGRYTFGMSVYSDQSSGETITFKAYDASVCQVYNIVSETYDFISDAIIGDDMQPEEIHASHDITQTITFSFNWNWFSINIQSSDMSLNNVLLSIEPNGEFIKDDAIFALYYEEIGWYSSNGLDEIDNRSMYMINLTAADNLSFTGNPVDYLNMPIDLVAGWNWIGYLPQLQNDLNNALASIESSGEFIKNQTAFATYYEEYGWYSSNGLDYMVPGDGYRLQMNAGAQLVYGVPGRSLARVVSAGKEDLPVDWSVDVHEYEHSMAVTGVLEIDGEESADRNDIVAAFINDECRGISKLQQFPLNERYEFGMLVYGVPGEKLSLRLYDASTGLERHVAEHLVFESDGIVGDGLEPYIVQAAVLGIRDPGYIPDEYSLAVNYPNPFNPVTTIGYGLPEDAVVSLIIYDIRGRQVATMVNSEHRAGWYEIQWNGFKDRGETASAGIYLYRIKAGDFVQTNKMILLK